MLARPLSFWYYFHMVNADHHKEKAPKMNKPQIELNQLRRIASDWRAANPERSGGVVLIFFGEVYGWKNALRDPQSERPGVYAVDAAGSVHVAIGGDEYRGACAWTLCCGTASEEITEQLELDLELERIDAGYADVFHPTDYPAVLDWHSAEFSRYSRALMLGELLPDVFRALTNRLNAHLRAYADQFSRA